MTLDEAIEHCREVALQCSVNNPKCSLDHIQLMSWLKELKKRRDKSKTELKIQDIKTVETIKTLGNYSEKEKEKYEFEKSRDFYNSVLDMVHKFRIENNL